MICKTVRALAVAMVAGFALGVAPVAQAVPISFTAALDGASENPSNASPGTGTATVVFDTDLHSMQVIVAFSGLTGNTTAAHIHCCVAPPGNVGVATVTPTFVGFPLGVTAGSYDFTYDMSLLTSFNAPFVANNGGTAASAEAALFAGLQAGQAYLNIHSSTFGGGEIRGFLGLSRVVPEPATLALLGLGTLGLVAGMRRRRADRTV